MAILAPQTARNYATGEYHRINKIESECSPETVVPRWLIWVGFYASAEARDLNPKEPMYTDCYAIPFADLAADPRIAFYELLMAIPPFAGTNAAPDEVPE